MSRASRFSEESDDPVDQAGNGIVKEVVSGSGRQAVGDES